MQSPKKPHALGKGTNSFSGHKSENNREDECDQNAETPKRSNVSKHFMSQTISAASKTTKKKILGERNDASDAFMQKSPLPRPKQVSHRENESVSKSRESPAPRAKFVRYNPDRRRKIFAKENDETRTSPDSNYDPLKNYLSPRPKFLWYNPDRSRERLARNNSIFSDEDSSSVSDQSELADDVMPLQEREEKAASAHPCENDDAATNVEERELENVGNDAIDGEGNEWGFGQVAKLALFLLLMVLSLSCILTSNPQQSEVPSSSFLDYKGYNWSSCDTNGQPSHAYIVTDDATNLIFGNVGYSIEPEVEELLGSSFISEDETNHMEVDTEEENENGSFDPQTLSDEDSKDQIDDVAQIDMAYTDDVEVNSHGVEEQELELLQKDIDDGEVTEQALENEIERRGFIDVIQDDQKPPSFEPEISEHLNIREEVDDVDDTSKHGHEILRIPAIESDKDIDVVEANEWFDCGTEDLITRSDVVEKSDDVEIADKANLTSIVLLAASGGITCMVLAAAALHKRKPKKPEAEERSDVVGTPTVKFLHEIDIGGDMITKPATPTQNNVSSHSRMTDSPPVTIRNQEEAGTKSSRRKKTMTPVRRSTRLQQSRGVVSP